MKKLLIVIVFLAIIAGGAYYFSTRGAEKDPKVQGYMDKAEELMDGKYYSKALEQYKLAINADPANTEAYTKAAEIYIFKRQYDEALELLANGESSASEKEKIYFMQGKVLFAAKDYLSATKAYESSYREDSNNWENVIAWVQANGYLENKREDSLELLKEISNEDSEGWRNYYLALLSFDDTSKMLEYLEDGAANESEELRGKKQKLLEVTQKINDDKEDVLQNNTLISYQLINAEMYQPAVPLLQKVITENDEYYAAYLYLGVCFENLGDMEKAVDNYEKATNVDPNQIQPWVFLAQAYAGQNNQKGSDEAYQEALNIEKKNESVRLDYARTLVEFGLFAQARREYQELIDLKTSKEMSYKVELAMLDLDYLDDYEEGLALAKEVVEDWDEFQSAESSFQAEALDVLGWAFNYNDQKDEAIKYLKQALEADPYLASAYYHLGVIYSEIENFIDAQENLERAVDLDLSGDIAAKANNELEKIKNENSDASD